MKAFWKLICGEEATTAVEYAVMLGLIIITTVVTVSFVGSSVADSFAEGGAILNSSSGQQLGPNGLP